MIFWISGVQTLHEPAVAGFVTRRSDVPCRRAATKRGCLSAPPEDPELDAGDRQRGRPLFEDQLLLLPLRRQAEAVARTTEAGLRVAVRHHVVIVRTPVEQARVVEA